MSNFGMKFAQFMMGRRGQDEFGIFLFAVAIIMSIVYTFTHIGALYYLSFIAIIYQIFRFMSRNIPKRYRENQKFLEIWNRFFHPSKNRQKKRSANGSAKSADGNVVYRYFNCPACGQKMRAPNGKGRIRVKCPRCDKQFETLV